MMTSNGGDATAEREVCFFPKANGAHARDVFARFEQLLVQYAISLFEPLPFRTPQTDGHKHLIPRCWVLSARGAAQ